ncbi:TOM1-like protein 2 [Trichinella britovi]|uniref:TOM1-like protein 2 n=1 Tax=Trichinella britovi TaxID=45882 RepID=A0A0V1CMG5_TRIBR|nr:TOM1-like protein 2 [Trichinella britovi]
MEQAREAAQAVSEFFQGNPLQTYVGQKIGIFSKMHIFIFTTEQATDANHPTENWSLIMEVCDLICSREDGPKEAIRAIKKRLQLNMGKNNTAVLYTLTLLEACVKNCGLRFHRVVAQKDFIQELIRLIGTKYDPPLLIQEKVLGLIRTWADTFRGIPELNELSIAYDELVAKGVQFPSAEEMQSDAPIITPKPSVIPAPRAIVANVNNSALLTCYRVSDEQLAKLRSELDVVNGNLAVFREMLSELNPGNEAPDDWALLQELHSTCNEMQKRIIELIQQISNDDVTRELLVLNDELNTVFDKYERYVQNRESASSERDAGTALIDFSDATSANQTATEAHSATAVGFSDSTTNSSSTLYPVTTHNADSTSSLPLTTTGDGEQQQQQQRIDFTQSNERNTGSVLDIDHNNNNNK